MYTSTVLHYVVVIYISTVLHYILEETIIFYVDIANVNKSFPMKYYSTLIIFTILFN